MTLPKVLLVPLSEFFWGKGWIRLNRLTVIDRAGMREWLGSEDDSGWVEFDDPEAGLSLRERAYAWRDAPMRVELVTASSPPTAAEEHASEKLGVTSAEIRRAALKEWKKPLDLVRDEKLGEISGLSIRQRQARRGHVTRQLLEDLGKAMGRPTKPRGRRSG
jgi:hypothetical protein